MSEQNFTVEEAANISRMSQSWWRQKIFRKEIRHLKIGRRVLIPKSVISDLFQKSVVEPQSKY